MSLYKHEQADFLLIDDQRARKIAIFNGLNTIGSVGMLLWGKKHQYFPALGPKLILLQRAGIFLSANVQRDALRLAGEA